jgi:RNA polymerase sigma-70 factor (ECF subfamily)
MGTLRIRDRKRQDGVAGPLSRSVSESMPRAPRESEIRLIYEACAPASFRRARALLGNEADAWDAVQEVFCRLAQSDALAIARSWPMAYVYRATTNACLNELQARRVRDRQRLAPDPSLSSTAGEAVHARDLLEKLDARIDDLDRRILILAFYDGLPQEQIADVLGVWRRTVGRRLQRLREVVAELERAPLQRTS